ncbi:MAG TPA: cytochrome c [Caulobacteraceae bacterium]|jgi:mono/diheme cytochrome c family protein|nr:cytochrome c [Caulobacteraceae bacterium]
MNRAAVALVLALVPSFATAEGGQDRLARLRIERGMHEALARCGPCHAVEVSGASPLAGAPAFRDLNKTYPVADLIAAIAEGAPTGHPQMPRFHLSQREREALVAYVRSVQR